MMLASGRTAVIPPGLNRAIIDCTQPQGHLIGDVSRPLQRYLADSNTLDTVYIALLSRAWMEPQSLVVVEKVIAVLKQLLLSYTPSASALQQIDEFCERISLPVPLQPAAQRGLAFVKSTVRKIWRPTLPDVAAHKPRSMDAAGGRNGLPQTTPPAAAPKGTVSVVSVGMPPSSRPAVSRYASLGDAAAGSDSPTSDTSALSRTATRMAGAGIGGSPSSDISAAAAGGGAGGGGGAAAGGTGRRTGHRTTRSIGFTSGSLTEAQRRSGSAADAEQGNGEEDEEDEEEEEDTWLPSQVFEAPRWSVTAQHLKVPGPPAPSSRSSGGDLVTLVARAPDLSPHLVAHAATAVSSSFTGSVANQPVTMATIVRCILDVEDADIPRHLHEIAEACKTELSQPKAVSDSGQAAEATDPVATPSRSQRAMLFQACPYNQQEPLVMSDNDVGAVIQAVCGRTAASSQPTTTLIASSSSIDGGQDVASLRRRGAGADASTSGAANSDDQWDKMTDAAGALGLQECGSILIKLVMDLWLSAGPGNAFPLVLRMLRRTLLGGGGPMRRCVAFDLLLNLSLHSALLKPRDDGNEAEVPWRQFASDPAAAAVATAATAAGAPSAAEDSGTDQSVQFERWLRALLFQLLSDMVQAQECSRDVWQSACGCALHMLTHGGHFVAAWVRHAPPSALRGLLRACLQHGWSQEVYCHLIILTSHVLQQHFKGPCASSTAGTTKEERVSSSSGSTAPGSGLASFGGVAEVLTHLGRAPTHQSRAALVAVLVHHLGGTGPGPLPRDSAWRSALMATLQTESACLALQACALHPQDGMAERLADVVGACTLHPTAAAAAAASSSDDGPGSSMFGNNSPLSVLLGRIEAHSLAAQRSREAESLAPAIEATMEHICAWSTDSTSSGMHDAEAAAAAWQAFKEQCSRSGPVSRQLAVGWLHRLLHRAIVVCQGNVLLLSPLNLRSAEANRLASGRQSTPQPGQWNLCLADALLHVVREVDDGCGLLLAAHLRAVSQVRSQPLPPSVNSSLKDFLGTGGSAGDEVNRHHRRNPTASSLGGMDPALLASGGALGGGSHSPSSQSGGAGGSQSYKLVMSLHHMTLLWMLQCGAASRAAASLATASAQLADVVLLALCTLAPDTGVPSHSAPRSASSLDITGAIVSGRMAFSPEVLPNTPPELLVSLLQQCAQQQQQQAPAAGAEPVLRGFLGRPQPPLRRSSAPPHQRLDGGDGDDGSALSPSTTGGGGGGRMTASAGAAADDGGGLARGDGGGSGLTFSASEGPWRAAHLDRRLSMLLALMARCALDPESFARYSLSQVLKGQLGSDDVRERYFAGVYLLKHWMLNQQDKYWRTLRQLIEKAQQQNDEHLLDNPYLQISSMLNVDA